MVDLSQTDAKDAADHRCGFVAICGRPNVGKSTLLNALLGQTVAIATPRPQTTRERLLGIWSEAQFQAVLVDTPGIHRARSALNRYMVGQAVAGARHVELVLLLAEVPALRDPQRAADWEPGEVAMEAFSMVRDLGHPIVLVLTKCDRLGHPDLLLPIIERWTKIGTFEAIVPVCAPRSEGLDELRREVVSRLPVGPPLFDPDDLSDRGVRWHAGEIIRAEIFAQLSQELPYSCAVVVDRFREAETRDVVTATVYVERDSQKGMVIGKGARAIKGISSAARARIAELTGRPCELRLSVSVAHNWTKDPDKLKRLGYREPEEGG